MKRTFPLWSVSAEVNGKALCKNYWIIAGSAEVAALRTRALLRKKGLCGRVAITSIKAHGTLDYIPAVPKAYWQEAA